MVTLLVSKDKQCLLDIEICIYTLPDDTFIHTTEEETGLTYHSLKTVKPITFRCFSSVLEAMKEYGGHIELF